MPSFIRRLLIATIVFGSSAALAQDYYVVIGSFSTQNAAVKFAGYARSLHYDADYIQNATNSLFYVYVLKTSDRKQASDQTIRLQRETEFEDAWLYHGSEMQPHDVVVKNEPAIEKPGKIPAEVNESVKEVIPENVKEEISKDPEKVEEVVPSEEVPTEVEPDEDAKPAITFEGPEKPVARGKFFKFTLETVDGKPVQGKVYNVDRVQGRDLATYKGNEYVDVLRPSVQGWPITIVSEIFGYNPVVKVIDYINPGNFKEATQDENGAWVIPFKLERLKKGDVSVMYKVAFYKDAVIMLPSSKPELDELVRMMQANPNYKIKIHGHNNGNERNLRIIMLGSDKNYFGMARSLSKVGSSRELSRLRAETIKSYLVDHGIAKNRIDTYAWGGTAMMVKPNTAIAVRLNNRVEIEILED